MNQTLTPLFSTAHLCIQTVHTALCVWQKSNTPLLLLLLVLIASPRNNYKTTLTMQRGRELQCSVQLQKRILGN